MNRYEAILHRLAGGERILLDGATGTEIEKRGVPMIDNAWNGGGALTHPDIVRQVHEDYIRTGAQIVISNTFSTSRHVLQDAGMEEHFEFLNRRGIELAREARANSNVPEILVAGGISGLSFIHNDPDPEQLRTNIADQAAIMADAGADLIMLEMMMDVERTMIILEAAKASGLPVWVGFSCILDNQGEPQLIEGPSLKEGVLAIRDQDVPVVFIMHTEVKYIGSSIRVLKDHWDGPIGVYAHSGKFEKPNWIFNDVISPEDYAAAAKSWLREGVQVVGSCCGTGVEHIRQLKALML